MEKYKTENELLDDDLNKIFERLYTAVQNSLKNTNGEKSPVEWIDNLIYPRVPYITPSLLKIRTRCAEFSNERNYRLKEIKRNTEKQLAERAEHFASIEITKTKNKLIKLVRKLVHILHTMLQLQYILNSHQSNQIHIFLSIFDECIRDTFEKNQEVLSYNDIANFD